MKAIVALPAYDRIDLLRQCVSGFEKNDTSLFDLMLFPDKTSQKDSDEIDRVARESSLGIQVYQRPKERLGCNLNITNAMRVVGEMDYTHIILVGSDILVSNNFVRDLLVLSEKFDAYAAAPTTGRHPLNEKLANVNSIIYGSITGQNRCIPTHHWRTIAPIVTAISDRFHPIARWNGANVRDCQLVMNVMLDAARKIQTPFTKPMVDHMGSGDVNAGEDGLVVTALAMYGIPMVSYIINRASHPSDTGTHTTKEVWEGWYRDVVIDELPPADPSKFKFV